jgi:hypothetical protein
MFVKTFLSWVVSWSIPLLMCCDMSCLLRCNKVLVKSTFDYLLYHTFVIQATFWNCKRYLGELGGMAAWHWLARVTTYNTCPKHQLCAVTQLLEHQLPNSYFLLWCMYWIRRLIGVGWLQHSAFILIWPLNHFMFHTIEMVILVVLECLKVIPCNWFNLEIMKYVWKFLLIHYILETIFSRI